mmetsp:Transcript_58692/g.128437  ORF Transcript_58692/g.128437 Transcript_58692/m.128437 type:complete len:544 (+) Transcript_58692:50-1681(+)
MDTPPPYGRLPSRPQSHRFIAQGLASRLSPEGRDDKSEWRPQSAATQVSSTRCETNRQVSYLCSAELERFRQSFQQEAEQCLSRLKEAMTSTGLGPICQQFLEARKTDSEELHKLRSHIEELFRLNAQLRQQTLDLLSAKELERLHGNICNTCELMNRLLDKMQKERSSDLKSLANDTAVAASKIFVEMMHNEWSTLKETWHLWRHEESQRFLSFKEHLELLETRVVKNGEDMELQFAAQSRRMSELSQLQTESLRAQEQRILEKVSKFQDTMMEQLKPLEAIQRLEAKLELVAKDAAAGAAAARKPVAQGANEELLNQKVSEIKEMLTDQVVPSLETPLTEISKRLEDTLQIEAMRREVLTSQHEAKIARLHSRRFEADMSELRLELSKFKADAADTEKARKEIERIQRELLRNVREVEKRGNVRVNLQGGEIEALRGFDFATKKGGNETDAKLADPIAGAVTMADVMELQQLLNVSMVVEGHLKGSTNKAAQSSADNRGKIVLRELVKRGMRPELLTSQGLPGTKGVNRHCVIVRMAIPDP